MRSVTGPVTTAVLNTKITEIENKIPHITNLATNPAEAESKIPEITNLATKATLSHRD